MTVAPPISSARAFWRLPTRVPCCAILGRRSCTLRGQVSDAHQVVRREREREHPIDAPRAPVTRLAHQPDRLEPAEDLFDPLAPSLAHGIPGMVSGATVNGTRPARRVLRHVRCHPEQADRRYELSDVVALVGGQCDAPPSLERAEQLEGGRAFRVAAGGDHTAADGQSVAVFHEHMPGVVQLRLLAMASLQLDARWKPLLCQYNSGIMRGDTVGIILQTTP